MNDIKLEIHGDNRGTITDLTKATIGTVNIAAGKQEQDVPIDLIKKETSIGKIVGKKLIEFVLGVLSGVASSLIWNHLAKNSIKAEFGIALLILAIILVLATLVLIAGAIVDLAKCVKVRKKGLFCRLKL